MGKRHAPFTASGVLEGVERWAAGCWMLREIELLGARPEDADDGPNPYDRARRQRMAVATGRLDALLVPVLPFDVPWAKKIGGWCWASARLVGVEVKVSRADFAKGLTTGQFDRYDAELGGLYVATPAGLVKTSEIPDHVGHLVVSGHYGHWVAVCRRHPRFTDTQPTPEMLWKVLAMYAKEQRAKEQLAMKKIKDGLDKAGRKLARTIAEVARG